MIVLLLSFLVFVVTTNVGLTNKVSFVKAMPNINHTGCKIRPKTGVIPESWVGSAGDAIDNSNKNNSNKNKHKKGTKGRKQSLDMVDFNVIKCFIAQEQERQIIGRGNSNGSQGDLPPGQAKKDDKQQPPGQAKKDKFEGTSVVEIQFFDDEPLEHFVLEQDKKNPNAYRGKRLAHNTGSTDANASLENLDNAAASFNMMVDDVNGVMTGSCQMNGKLYHFGSLEDGEFSVTEVALEDLPPDNVYDDDDVSVSSSTSALGDGSIRNRNLRSLTNRENHDVHYSKRRRNQADEHFEHHGNVINSSQGTLQVSSGEATEQAGSPQTVSKPILSFEGTSEQFPEGLINNPGKQPQLPEAAVGNEEEWVIDVMVPYTQRVLCAISEALTPTSCVANDRRKQLVEARIKLAIQESNVALENSGIQGRVRLVHSFLVPNSVYDEQVGGLTYDVILSHAASRSTDGVDSLAYFQTIREQTGADLVSFWVDNENSCGWAYTGTPVDLAGGYSVVNWLCATGYFSFIHEIGHHLGGRHDRNVEDCNLTPRSCCFPKGGCDRYAYQDPLGRFRSIMAYNCPQSATGRCPRVQYFSQPNYQLPVIDTAGNEFTLPLGDPWNNNALAPNGIQANFREIAAFYPSSAASNNSCGNGICESNFNENCQTCPNDCIGGTTSVEVCGNKICEAGENCYNCPSDCAQRIDIYNDFYKYCCVGGPTSQSLVGIEYGQTCGTFPACEYGFLGCSTAPKQNEISFCCGNGICEAPGEGVWNCPADCACVNDGICDTSFEDDSCNDCRSSNTNPGTGTCLANNRICNGIQPEPCCGRCNESTRRCTNA